VAAKADEAPVPVPSHPDFGKPSQIANQYCIGKEGSHGHSDHSNGRGFICVRAIGKPGCTTKSQLESLYCACCACYVECGMSNTEWDACAHDGTCGAALGGGAHAAVALAPSAAVSPHSAARPKLAVAVAAVAAKADEAPVPVPSHPDFGKPSQIANQYCIGKEGSHGHSDHSNGRGFICVRAIGKPGCTTKSQLESLYCACCACYVECGMSNTEWDACAHDGACDTAVAGGDGRGD